MKARLSTGSLVFLLFIMGFASRPAAAQFEYGRNYAGAHVGLVLGYEVASWSWKGNYSYLNEYYSPSAGGFTIGGSAGIRYFFNDNWAAQARVGFGFYLLAVGVDYKF